MAKYKRNPKVISVQIGGVVYDSTNAKNRDFVFDTEKQPKLEAEIIAASKAGYLVELESKKEAPKKTKK